MTDAHAIELEAIREATQWLYWYFKKTRVPPYWGVRIFSDSQSAIQSMASMRASCCQKVITRIIIYSLGKSVTIHWVPGHKVVLGNERADELARKTTEKETLIPDQDPAKGWKPNYLIRQEVQKRNIKAVNPYLKNAAGRYTKEVDKALSLQQSHKLYEGLNAIISVLCLMNTT